jgi:hypothetical protein
MTLYQLIIVIGGAISFIAIIAYYTYMDKYMNQKKK